MRQTKESNDRIYCLKKKKTKKKIKQVRSLTKAAGIADIGIHRDDLI